MGNLIEQFLEWIKSLIKSTPTFPDDSQFEFRLIQSGRPGQILYGGVLRPTQGKVHYLECLPLTYAEQRIARIATQQLPGTPIETHKICFFYYRLDDPDKEKKTVFFSQFSFAVAGMSADWLAVSVTNDLFHEIKRVSKLKHVDLGNTLPLSPQKLLIKCPEASMYWCSAISIFLKIRGKRELA